MSKVMLFGTFDIVHLGHINLLWQARSLADEMIVVIARDETVMKIKKIKTFNNELARRKNIKRLLIADKVIFGSKGRDKHKVIRLHKPDLIALGYDQNNFTDGLANALGVSKKIKVLKLKPYHPKVYKSSIIKNLLNKKSVQ